MTIFAKSKMKHIKTKITPTLTFTYFRENFQEIKIYSRSLILENISYIYLR